MDATDPANFIVGIGFADQDGCFYIHIQQASDAVRSYVKEYLCHVQLTAFNVLFDGGFLQRFTGKWLDWRWCSYGLFKMLASEGHPQQSWNLETAQRTVLGWQESNKQTLEVALKERGLGKADMWLLPPGILGDYCAYDADAAWQLLGHLQNDLAALEMPRVAPFHQREFITSVKLLVEQQFAGIEIDRIKLIAYHAELLRRIDTAMNSFLTHPEVLPHIEQYHMDVEAAWIAAVPPHTKKNGEVTKRYENWMNGREAFLAKNSFNPNSKKQLGWLFFTALKRKVITRTKGGQPSVDRKTLPLLGEAGKALAHYNKLTKERGYVDAVLAKSARTGRLHPQFNSYGTITGRLGGSGGLNIQQQPKTRGFLECWKAGFGSSLVQLDAEALEPTVLAEFSQDPSLLAIYGPTAKPNDLYLFVAAKIQGLGDRIKTIYDPDNPTPESIGQAKKEYKRDRSIAKLCVLACNYGAFPPKIHETLTMGGIDISLTEVRKIHTEYWRVFAGVKKFEETLLAQWQSTGGWIPSLAGLPLPIAPKLLKDRCNKFCQAGGHWFLQTILFHVDRLRHERNIPMRPWIVDFHDETIWETPTEFADKAAQILSDALSAANADYGMEIQIKGEPTIVENLATVKCED